MKGFLVMLKINCKLLLRSKGYLCCIILIPIIAVILINVDGSFAKEEGEKSNAVMEWKSVSDTSDLEYTKLTVKVYDYSNSEASAYLLEKLAQTHTYKLYLVNTSKGATEKESYEDILENAKKLMESSTVRAILYIPEDFLDVISKEEGSPVKIIKGYNDSRIELLQSNIEWYCSKIQIANKIAIKNGDKIENVLNNATKQELKKNVSVLEDEGGVVLDEKQQESRSRIGYALSILTVSFIFSGVFIVDILIKEKENRCINRISLSLTTNRCYVIVKLCLILITAIIQVIVFGIGTYLTLGTNVGIPYSAFIGMVLLQGILFNFVSLVIGVIVNNLLGTTFLSFTVWSMSCLLAGLYFPVVSGSTLEKISMFTPQRWFIKSTEMFMIGTKGVFIQYTQIFLAFMIVFFTISMISLKIQEKE